MRALLPLAFVLVLASKVRAESFAFMGMGSSGGPAVLIAPTSKALPGIDPGLISANPPILGASGVIMLRAGILFGREEIALAVSPFTSTPYVSSQSSTRYIATRPTGPVFQANLEYAHYFPIWHGHTIALDLPTRIGAGGLGGEDTQNVPFFTANADVGVALRVDRFILDLRLPGFRYAVSLMYATVHVVTWQLGLDGSVLF